MTDERPNGDVMAELASTEHVLPAGPSARHLLIVAADGTWMSRSLPADGALTIGRGAEADVRIDERMVSRRHARLEMVGTSDLRLIDLGSANGTLVGGKLVRNAGVAVRPGEAILIGRTVLAVHVPPPAESGPQTLLPGLAMTGVDAMVARAAPTLKSVLLLGETGVGKGVVAQLIHQRSTRRGREPMQLNCAGLSADLLESELFGHERGAFTGAAQSKPGLLEAAAGGTVFLDEIGEMPMEVQAKLLLAIEQRITRRIGSNKTTSIDVRFICATHRDLEAEIGRGRFRADFYYRINGFTIRIPPLRERRDEIDGLILQFACDESARSKRDRPIFDDDARAALHRYGWPGNIRELRHVVERAVLLADGDVVTAPLLVTAGLPAAPPPEPSSPPPPPPSSGSGRDELRARVIAQLAECGGNQSRAARMLKISRNTLARLMDEFGMPRPRPKYSKSQHLNGGPS